jgi:hypothetical protein
MRKRKHANMPSKKRRLAQLEGEKKKIAKTPMQDHFFSGNEELKIMILYIPILLLFLRI